MVLQGFIAAGAVVAIFTAFPDRAWAMYSKNSAVLQVDAKSYGNVIAESNHTSIVEFYAPWCGHCQSLKPAYEKAAKSLHGLAKVAAVNCDEESNKAFCGGMGVQGFPTLKIVRPGKKRGRPNVEEYQGPRSAKGIVDAVLEKIPNNVRRLGDKDIESWLKADNDTAKAILFTNKGTTSPLLKAVAVDFLDGISFAQIRDKEKAAVEMFNVKSFPSLILLSGGDREGMIYDGPMKKETLVEFFSQVSSPNPDPAPKASKPAKDPSTKDKEKKTKKKEDKKQQQVLRDEEKKEKEAEDKDKAAFEQASSSHASEEASEFPPIPTSIELEDQGSPTESPEPIVSDTPAPQQILEVAPPIPSLENAEELEEACLRPTASTCILALLPSSPTSVDSLPPQVVIDAQANLAEIVRKYNQRHAAIFPFYVVPASNAGGGLLRSAFTLPPILAQQEAAGAGAGAERLEIIATNRRRGWWRRFDGDPSALLHLESWIDAIRLGEGTKEKLPEDFLPKDEPTAAAEAEAGAGDGDGDGEGKGKGEEKHDEL